MAEITIRSKYQKDLTARPYSKTHINVVTKDDLHITDMLFSLSDAHKLADWIKENIPQPPPEPPKWRIDTSDGEATLIVGDGYCQAVWINKNGEFCGDKMSEFVTVTPELHKEMICALLDAHYELHKGDS